MSNRHTPGPWHVDTLDGTVYAANHRTVPQNVADSRLIAAAPELLAALQEIHDDANALSWLEIKELAAAVIAKATQS